MRMISKLSTKRCCRLIVSLLAFAFVLPIPAADDTNAEREGCRKNLNALYNAIQAYRADQKDLPGWLSDLVPQYLKDPNALVCPATRRTGNVNTMGSDDPKISTTY